MVDAPAKPSTGLSGAKPYCGLCGEPKFRIGNHGASEPASLAVWLCSHCDVTINCKGSRCGACEMVREKEYPELPSLPDGIGPWPKQ